MKDESRERVVMGVLRVLIVVCVALTGSLWAGLKDVPHPRLWLTEKRQAELVLRMEGDPLVADLHRAVMREADRILEMRTCRYEIPDGRRLLAESRLALHQISHCAWAWRFTGEEKYLKRAIREMDAACAMVDWNPAHFLDTAEMALAVAWGYDWLYGGLDAVRRTRYEDALLEKALRVADAEYARDVWWAQPNNNWAQVCGAGIALAAAAVAERDEKLAGRLFYKGLRLVESCHVFYQPDGMYPEGPGYWHYGTSYHVLLLSACDQLGIGYADDPALRKSGEALIHLKGPSGLSFNFADAKAHKEQPSAAHAWIARRYQDKAQAGYVRRMFRVALDAGGKGFSVWGCVPMAVVWLPEDGGEVGLPLSAVFRGEQPVAAYRTSWGRDAVWFAIKGGRPGVSHGQMDVGSFVHDAHGERWFHDMGGENYNLPGYFGSRRWEYFRSQNRSHNTLEIGGRLQDWQAESSPLCRTEKQGSVHRSEFDLTHAYAGSASQVTRAVEFDERSGVVVLRDGISKPVGDIAWRAFTDAEARVEGRRVVLSKNGRKITLHRRSEKGEWSIESPVPPTAAENQNDGYRAVTLTVPSAAQVDIEVEIRP